MEGLVILGAALLLSGWAGWRLGAPPAQVEVEPVCCARLAGAGERLYCVGCGRRF